MKTYGHERLLLGDLERAVAGWQAWLDTVATWLREGRSLSVFIYAPTTRPARSDTVRHLLGVTRAR
jgi:hypothetical protein